MSSLKIIIPLKKTFIMSSLKDAIQDVFTKNPTVNEVYVTSDDNIFQGNEGLRFCKSHCKTAGVKMNIVTREEAFKDAAAEESNTASTTPAPVATPAPDVDWKTLKFGEIVDFAKEKGLEAKTKKTAGTKKLIEEVEAFLATLEVVEESNAPVNESSQEEGEGNGEDQYTPVTNHQSQD